MVSYVNHQTRSVIAALDGRADAFARFRGGRWPVRSNGTSMA